MTNPVEDVHPHFLREPRSKTIDRSTAELLERLVQTMESENEEIDTITAEFKKLALKHGFDYGQLSQTILTSETDPSVKEDSISAIVSAKAFEKPTNSTVLGVVNYDSNYETERIQLLAEIQREMKLKCHYEDLLGQYESLLSYALEQTRDRRRKMSKDTQLCKRTNESKQKALLEANDRLARANNVKDIEIAQALEALKLQAANLTDI